MTNHTLLLLLAFMASQLLSCNGQGKSRPETAEILPTPIGKTVSALDSNIWSIYQDSKEDYWFGSNGKGLYRFDGELLQQFTTADGLIDNTIRGIQEDKAGNLFIQTPTGVSKFDGKQFTSLEVITSPDNQWKLTLNDLWFNCNGNADNVYRFDGKNLYELQLPKQDLKGKFNINEASLSYSPYTVFGIDKDKNGHMWFGTVLAGAYRFDGESFLWFGEQELSRLPDGREPGVRSMLQDKAGNFWLSNFKHKYKIDPNSPNGYEILKAAELSSDIEENKMLYFNSGLVDKEGNLWMITYGGGLWKYDGETLANFELKGTEEDLLLLSIFLDKQGVLWLATRNDGAYRYDNGVAEKFKIENKEWQPIH